MIHLNLNIQALSQAITQVKNIIDNVLTCPQAQWILKAHKAERSEYAISYNNHGQIEKHVIDRTFIDENGKYVYFFNKKDVYHFLKRPEIAKYYIAEIRTCA